MKMTEIQNDMVRWRRALHQIPEIGLKLPQTVTYVTNVLKEELNLNYELLLDGNAIVVLIQGEKPGKTIALRADMDGLAIVEETSLPFASKNGNMHACGHDGHTAMLLGAAKFLTNNKDQFNGTVKLLFQPGEEGPGGAKPMIEEGALENPKVDAIFGIHEGNISKELKTGNLAFKKGPMMASSDSLVITIKGKGSHGAYPQDSVDPIVIAAELILSLQQIVSREINPSEAAVISICMVHSGTALNIIPEETKLGGTVRTLNQDTREFIAKRIKEISSGIALAKRAEIVVEHTFKYPALVNDEEITELAMNAAKTLYPEDVITLKEAIMGGEDMAFFLEKVPGCYAYLSNPKQVEGEIYPHHNSKFDVDESYFQNGANLLVQVAIDFLSK
ncbi:M20 metallopeptidase family protein [Fusibacter bizertensis]